MTHAASSAHIVRTTRRLWLAQTAAVGATLYLSGRGLGQDKAATKPMRPELLVRQEQPFNAEPELAELVKSAVTPIDQFYVRSHGPVPKVDPGSFRVKISGLVNKELEFSVAELKEKFDTHKIAATLTCAGNRRQEMSAIKKVAGVQWDAGAIGHASWMGPMLSEVLRAAEIKPDAKHVWLEGLDPIKEKDGSEAPFGGSIPLEKAMHERGDELPSLLAHTMNDEPLTAAHGAPLRLVVPGYIGARSVKWLAKIMVSDKPSTNHYLAEAYKIIQTDDPAEVAKADPIYEYPLNVAIGLPVTGTRLPVGRHRIQGYVLAGGQVGNGVTSLEISSDNGRNWRKMQTGFVGPFSWTLWSTEVNILPGKQTLIVRASDQHTSTPEQGKWNLKGYMFNAWHRVRVEGV